MRISYPVKLATALAAAFASASAFATLPTFSIISPKAGTTVASPVTLRVQVRGAEIGYPMQGLDHLHVSVDHGPEHALYHNDPVSIRLPAGPHTIYVEIAGPTHEPLEPPKSVAFVVK